LPAPGCLFLFELQQRERVTFVTLTDPMARGSSPDDGECGVQGLSGKADLKDPVR
jgi:hypothetical protein